MTEAAQITRRAKSNLAFAFTCVPRDRRPDLDTFYAFCRTVDDLADDTGLSLEERRAGLDAWKEAFLQPSHPAGSLQAEVLAMRERRDIDPELFREIIRGCESDLVPQRFGTWEDLQRYCYQVASAVGLILVRLFGASKAANDYAISLGYALQITNIIRDVGEDLRNGGRIYLPLADLARFQYTERDLIGNVHDGRFLSLMNFEAERAEELYRQTAALLPDADRLAMRPAEVMRSIYYALLQRIRKGQFHVFDHRYKVPKIQKISILARHMICGKSSN